MMLVAMLAELAPHTTASMRCVPPQLGATPLRCRAKMVSWVSLVLLGRLAIRGVISEFLYSPNGGTYISNLRFNGTLNCKQRSPSITVSAIPISYIKDDDPSLGNYKRKILDSFISSLNNDSSHKKIFSDGVYYFVWDLNEHVRFELWRNLGVAMLCILVVTLLLLNNFTACTLVNVSVIMTVVNVVGFVRFWDISIDVVSLCTIVVVVGICVDYPVHIIHCYLVSTGNLII